MCTCGHMAVWHWMWVGRCDKNCGCPRFVQPDRAKR
jgi:hypothetical protein